MSVTVREEERESPEANSAEAGARKRKVDDVFRRSRAAAAPLTNVKLSKSVNPLLRRKNRVRTDRSCGRVAVLWLTFPLMLIPGKEETVVA